jgi:hypothetical protein
MSTAGAASFREKGGERVMAILRFQGCSPRLCRLRTALFWPQWASLELYWSHVRFMGPRKSRSLITTLSNCTSLLEGGFMEGKWGSPGWQPSQTIVENQDFIRGAGARFRPSRDFAEGCHMQDQRGHAYDVLLGSYHTGCTPIRIAVTLSDMSDQLLIAIIS